MKGMAGGGMRAEGGKGMAGRVRMGETKGRAG